MRNLIRNSVRRSETLVGLVRDSRKMTETVLGLLRKGPRPCGPAVLREYLSTHSIRKLHIGAGDGALQGWLNTDIDPGIDDVFLLDATKPFPFADQTFDYVYSEHMIEHISRREALFMLRESCRVLKPGGTIRTATPDLEVIAGLYLDQKNPDKQRYIQWITDRFVKKNGGYHPGFVINQAFYNWGHQFLYDADLLGGALREAGFVDIRRYPMGISEDGHLHGIEAHGKSIQDEHIAAFETLVLEAKRPSDV